MNENDNLNNEEQDSAAGTASRNTKAITAIGVAAVAMLITGFAIWYFVLAPDGSAGKPVPAPRSVPDEQSGSQPISGQTLTIGAEQRENAGLVIETVGEQLAAELGLTAATGVVEPDAYRNTPVLALIGGVVRRVTPELGDRVARGQTVAVVFSNEFAEAQSRFITLRTEAENARKNFERTQSLVAINQPGRAESEAAVRQMRAAEAALAEMQARFQRTTRLLAIGGASREELEQDTTKLRTAEADVAEARSRYERANRLLEVKPEVRSQNEEALNKLRAAEGDLAAAKQRLLLYGMNEARINALRSSSQIRSEMEVRAPVSGTVTGRTANIGEVVEAGKELIRVTDLSTVWVIAQAFERDLPKLRVGSGASVTTAAYPERIFRGQVTYIDPAIDPATRTAKVRIEIGNGDRSLKLGMFVNVAFGSLQQSERTVPVVPAAAVQTVNGKQAVFLATSDPNVFELRQVSLGPESGGRYPVLEGVNVGERIVTTGSFLLRAEWVKMGRSN
jgi:RND family efflux transporter MFP subunit